MNLKNFVKSFLSEALDWHSIWIRSGRPQSGFVYDMRRSTRKAYHKQVDFVLKRENKIKHGRPQGGGGKRGPLPPPWKFKNMGAPPRIT